MNPLIIFFFITIIFYFLPVFLLRYGSFYLMALVPTYLIIGNVFAESFFVVHGDFIQSLAVPIYSAIFLIANILTEHYGKKEANKAILIGFICQLIFLFAMVIITNTNIIPSSLEHYKSTFKVIPRLILGSMLAYLASQFLDILMFHAIKIKTGGKKLIVRNQVSTALSQLVDTTILMIVAFWGVPPFETLTKLVLFILTTWVFKVIIGLMDYPFLAATNLIYTKKS